MTKDLKLRPDGVIVLPAEAPGERVRIGLLLDQTREDGGLHSSDQADAGAVSIGTGFPKQSGQEIEVAGTIKTLLDASPMSFVESAKRLSDSAFKLHLEVAASSPVPQKTLCLNVQLGKDFRGRTVLFDGKPILIPEDFGEPCLFYTPAGQRVSRIEIPAQGRLLVIEGESLDVLFCQYQNGVTSLRLYLAPPNTEVEKEELAVTISANPYTSKAVDLIAAANRAFRDDVRDDGRGGWTDQGPQNDLRSFPIGERSFGNVGFQVIDPKANAGRSCVVLSASQQGLPKEAVLPFKGGKLAYLYLLHASAWTPREDGALCGRVVVHYKGGHSESFEVRRGRDINDWWDPVGGDNAAIAWKDKNESGAMVGLYLSRFPLEEREVESVTLTPTGDGVWMVAGLSGVQEAAIPVMPKDTDVPVTTVTAADESWREFTFSKNVVAGGALDFSFLQDAPAGKYGPVIIKGGKFVFRDRPDRPVRFFGTNVTGEIVTALTNEQCEEIATRLAAMGYNSVRLHHFDDYLIKAGSTTPELDPQRLDRMDYLIHCLKQRGIYIVADLYISRLKGFPEKFDNLTQVKFAGAFLPDVRDNIKAYAKSLLTHTNPYTGLPLKDEPALATLAMINENVLATHYTFANIDRHPRLKAAFEAAFRQWCEGQGVSAPEKPSEDTALLTRFLMERQAEYYADMNEFTRSLGAQMPTSDANHRALYVMAMPRSTYDFVEDHMYHDHPDFAGEAFASDAINHNESALSRMEEFLQHGSARIFGKPFMMTEWNFCYPNLYRSESGPIMGAYAALQDWDGIYRFDYSGLKATAFGSTHTWAFNSACDPIQSLSDRIAALLFLRQDVSAAKTKLSFVVTPEIWKQPFASGYLHWESIKNAWFLPDYVRLGSFAQIGSNWVTSETSSIPANAAISFDKLPMLPEGFPVFAATSDFTKSLEAAGLVSATAYRPQDGLLASENGEILANTREKAFRVITERSECLVQQGSAQAGRALSVKNNTTFSTIFAGSIDGKGLTDSRRVLVLHLTDLRNSGEQRTEFRGKITIARGTGKYPLLIPTASAEVSLKSNNSGQPTIWSLDTTGQRLAEVPCEVRDGEVVFSVNTVKGDVKSLAYEIVWPNPVSAEANSLNTSSERNL